MKATHFGAGNIGRGFIGEILFLNGFTIDFIDINDEIIKALTEKQEYMIKKSGNAEERIHIENVTGINSRENPEAVIQSIAGADIITTAIGPSVLPLIAELIARGIQQRKTAKNQQPLDIVACENMIKGSSFLGNEVKKWLGKSDMAYFNKYIGFPNAAVDRIVPAQSNDDPLSVTVEPFREWLIDQTACKQTSIKLEGVEYVSSLQPYIERKLFSVNTGHATVAYTGAYYGCHTIIEAMKHPKVLRQLENVLKETSALLLEKWGFDQEAHAKYTSKVIERFKNPYISDSIARVARTPIRKIGYDERFIKPIRELKSYHLPYEHLLEVTVYLLKYYDESDSESVKMNQLLNTNELSKVIAQFTGLKDCELVEEIVVSYLTVGNH
ncbi:mannitol-1-phosphate 5-dehydrogenase [Vagococcus elongatus]|uniref:Mannitol-1-phosphate 5-dehydrogenase n=1 Tax=Vagococcus elongatus TaxID=180344 RepID=A0A430AMB5_9ENTE|nr:mannitol-1-phosphate 5-dehydrogenase [Vagococcus elongatus]RSU09272.1 mannitol-1-phosphate 5-dehydrogenase [Vagococcus elongatus]